MQRGKWNRNLCTALISTEVHYNAPHCTCTALNVSLYSRQLNSTMTVLHCYCENSWVKSVSQSCLVWRKEILHYTCNTQPHNFTATIIRQPLHYTSPILHIHYITQPLHYTSPILQIHFHYTVTTLHSHYITKPLHLTATCIRHPLDYTSTCITPPLHYTATTLHSHYITQPLESSM